MTDLSLSVLAAEYTNGSKTRSPTLEINRIANGLRTPVIGCALRVWFERVVVFSHGMLLLGAAGLPRGDSC